jgi:TRAP-type C4-dicarboxylate transport system substrate-binding protein
MKLIALFAAAALAVSGAAAAPLKIKLATIAPAGSSYEKSLRHLGDAWRKHSEGRVELMIYAGGKYGSEAEMVGLIKGGSLQAAMLTAVGLSEIEPAVAGLQNIPMGFRNLDEVDYIGEKLQPKLEQLLERKGFVVLFWSDTGWVRFFSNKPVQRPDDLKKLKLFSWAGFPEQVQIYKSAGFNPVPLETADIVPGLQTGLIDAVPMPPNGANFAQVDLRAGYMLELNWAPLVGALVISQSAWEKIPAATRAVLKQDALEISKDLKAIGRKESDQAVVAMQGRKLKVTQVTPEIEEEWRRAAEAAYPHIRGKLVPADIFDEVLQLLKEYRAGRK